MVKTVVQLPKKQGLKRGMYDKYDGVVIVVIILDSC